MHIKSERGSGDIVWIGLLGLVVLAAVLMFGMAANSKGMAEGAETIANTLTSGDANVYTAWKGKQTLYPNKHAVQNHGADAWATVDCYNRNGSFHVMSNADGDFNLLCRDDDNQVRDVILKRRGNTNVFDFVNAYTPKGGNLGRIENWLRNTWRCGKGQMPNDAIIVIDNIIP